jgi:FAD binding domain/D-arabinono-1,4-lactone oxidase
MDDSKLSRRSILALSGAAALQAACARTIPSRAQCLVNAPEIFPPLQPGASDPLPGFTPQRRHVWAFDELHGTDADIYHPQTPDELAAVVAAAYQQRRKITVRGGGKSLGQQSLGKTIVMTDAPAFQTIGEVKRENGQFVLTCGAGARWGDVVRTISDKGYVPRTVVTTGDATVGGTAVVDGVSRMSPMVGKESEQILRFKMIDGTGKLREYTECDSPEFYAALAGFGAVGVMTEVTFRVARAIPGVHVRPDVETYATRYLPGTYDWNDVLRSIARDSRRAAFDYENFQGSNPDLVPKGSVAKSSVIGLSLVCWFAGEGLAIDRLEHRYVHNEAGMPIPGGLYTEGSAFARFGEAASGYAPTLMQLVSTAGFPNGYYVDELCGFLFFLGNSTMPAIRAVRARGARLNCFQQSYVIPAPLVGHDCDVRLARQFLFMVLSRCRERSVRPFSVDLLHLDADKAYLSASRGIYGFAVTVTFVDHDAAEWNLIQEVFMALSHDALTLGGRVHLVKNVEADRADLRAMFADGLKAFKEVKSRLDPGEILSSEFYERYFAGEDF